MTKDLHEIQRSILKVLLFTETARFSELNAAKVSTDQFNFHLKQLLAAKLAEKGVDGKYRLTHSGKDYANRLDVDSGTEVKIEKQAKLGVFIVARRKNKGRIEYLMQHRLKQPFFGFRGFVTGKIKIGESVAETAARELEEEAGLTANLTHKAIYHERIYSLDKQQLLEDKYFFIFLADSVVGNLIENFEGGRNEWVSASEVTSGAVFYDILDILRLLKSKHVLFAEKTYVVEKF